MKKPNIIRVILAVAACRLARFALRLLKRGGTALPGKAAMKFCPTILEVVSRGMTVIVVTGTNGKTTTSHLIENAMTAAGRDTLANKSGANLLSGITAELCDNAGLTGKPKKRYAVIECDEGAMKQVIPLLRPKVITVTNLFRDQLDRYGEVTHTLNAIRAGIEKAPDCVLCLNADDSLTVSLARGVPNRIVYYGMNVSPEGAAAGELSDAKRCIFCGAEYEYDFITYAHLGGFRCPKCGYKRPDPEIFVSGITEMRPDGSVFEIAKSSGEKYRVDIGLPAVYNMYNAAAAAAAYTTAGFATEELISSLSSVKSSFGRMETFDLDGVPVRMILVKNPTGLNQAIDYLGLVKEDFNYVFCLNDNIADGRDISWIWDADFEKLSGNAHIRNIYVSGRRADDMKLRMKYAGMPTDIMKSVATDEEIINIIRGSELPVYIMPNYTCMLTLRAALSRVTGKNEFWKG